MVGKNTVRRSKDWKITEPTILLCAVFDLQAFQEIA